MPLKTPMSKDAMSQRANDNVVAFVITNPKDFSHAVVNMALDLRDARVRIAELETETEELHKAIIQHKRSEG